MRSQVRAGAFGGGLDVSAAAEPNPVRAVKASAAAAEARSPRIFLPVLAPPPVVLLSTVYGERGGFVESSLAPTNP